MAKTLMRPNFTIINTYECQGRIVWNTTVIFTFHGRVRNLQPHWHAVLSRSNEEKLDRTGINARRCLGKVFHGEHELIATTIRASSFKSEVGFTSLQSVWISLPLQKPKNISYRHVGWKWVRPSCEKPLNPNDAKKKNFRLPDLINKSFLRV